MDLILNCYGVMCVSYCRKNPPVKCVASHTTWKELEQKQLAEAAARNLRYSQSRGSARCGRRWHF
jgi:hypothetical protein